MEKHQIDIGDFCEWSDGGEVKIDYARIDEELMDGDITYRDLYNLAYKGNDTEVKVAIGWLNYQGIETLDDVRDWLERNLFEKEATIARPAIVGLLALRDERSPREWKCWKEYNAPLL